MCCYTEGETLGFIATEASVNPLTELLRELPCLLKVEVVSVGM